MPYDWEGNHQSINQSFIVVKTIKLTPRPRMALNGVTLQQQLTVHNTGAEQQKLYTRMLTTKCQTTRVTNKNEIY